MIEIFKREQEEFNKLIYYMRNLFNNIQSQSIIYRKKQEDLIREFDLAISINHMKKLIDNGDEAMKLMKKENELLRVEVKDFIQKLKTAEGKIKDLSDQNTNINAQIMQLKNRIPEEIKWEEVSFRHQKHKY